MQPDPTKDSICQALFVSYNASSSKAERTAADTYLQNIKESTNGLNLSIHLFQNTMDPPVLFYCLHVIQHSIDKRWHTLNQDTIIMMNQLLLSFIGQVCCKNNLFNAIPSHVRSKIAQLLVKLMKRQYLISWDTFFKDLMELLKHNDGTITTTHGIWDMFYRILQDLNWSIHENRNESQEELSLNTKIKDKMREYDVQQMVDIWYLFLTNYTKYDTKLCQQCLITMDKYISWIDIAYISAPRFLNVLYQFLDIVSFQNQSVDCLYEIVTKRMDYTKKFELLESIKIVDVIHKLDINNSNIGTYEDKLAFAESISGLMEGIGIELTGCCKDNVPNASYRILDGYDLALKYFSHPSFKVNQACCQFLFAFWSMTKRKNDRMANANKATNHTATTTKPINERERGFFNRTVELISMHLCYPPQYDIHDPDEAEAEFDDYRKEQLDKLITCMTRAYPQYMLDLIGNHFSKTCQMISNESAMNMNNGDRKSNDASLVPWQNIESDLHFIYKICEGFHLRNIDELIRGNSKFGNLFEYSLKANICTKHPHPKILLTYFDIIHRYNVFFASHPQYIAQVLQLFVVCIQQNNNNPPNTTLRAQAAYTLQKLISKLYALQSHKVNQVLLQYMHMLIQSLGSCLQIYINQKRNMCNNNNNKNNNSEYVQQQFDSVDIKNICGVLGQLVLLNKKSDQSKLYTHCNKICGIFMNELKHYVVNRNEWIGLNAVFISQIMSDYISCVQCFFKPFGFVSHTNNNNNNNNNDHSNECIENVLIEFTDIVIQSYSCLPNDDDLRQVSISFVHKAVYILRKNMMKQLNAALKLYIEYMNANNAVFTLQVITNIVLTLRSHIVPILDEVFYALFEKIIHMLASFGNHRMGHAIGNSGSAYAQDIISKNEIRKHLYTFLLKTFQSGCFEIFISNKNAAHFDKVVNYILNGCVIREDLDIAIYKICFTLLKEMLSAMKNHPSMKDLFCNKVVKISFDFALHREYKAKRPEYDRTLKTHIFGIHHLMFKIFGNDVITNCIGSYLVTQVHLDRNTAKQYCELCIKRNQQRKLKEIILSARSMTLNTNQL